MSFDQARRQIAAAAAAFLSLICAVHAEPADPVFSKTGPEADAYGAAVGYPAPARGSPTPAQENIVGLFSHFDRVTTMRTVPRADPPSVLKRAAEEIAPVYQYDNKQKTIDDYLEEHPVTACSSREATPFCSSTIVMPVPIGTV
jgi:hypothetical protein